MNKKTFLFNITLLIFSSQFFVCHAKSSELYFLKINDLTLAMELAETREKRSRGLMFRKILPINRGMLFIFDTNRKHCMWMKNTSIPLSVAFIDKNGRVTNIEKMQPYTLTPHCALANVKYALEVNMGWFETANIYPRTQLLKAPIHLK